MNSQPGGWEPVLKETFEKMKTKAVGKSDACRNAWNICRFSRFSKSSQGRGRGRGHIGQSWQVPQDVSLGLRGPWKNHKGEPPTQWSLRGVCQRNQTPQRAESCIRSEWLARPRLLQIWLWTCERRIPCVPTLCRRSGCSHSQPGTMQVCNQRVRGSRAAGMETPSRAQERALVWHSEMNCWRRHGCWQNKRLLERGTGWREGRWGNPGLLCHMARSLWFYGDGVTFWVVSGPSPWFRVLPGGATSLSQDGCQQRGFWEVGRTYGLAYPLSF